MEYSEEEVLQNLLWSIKADSACGPVRKIFNLCRASPVGRLVDPGYCVPHAKSLISCYQQVKEDKSCHAYFDEALACLKEKKAAWFVWDGCEEVVAAYLSCYEPACLKYSDYAESRRLR
mmetsp:Transcript_22385/g.40445  ORF Transcript_22385/g.40445 Transcript_22385/m.40445 type:complete len:119 (+) Transcript_22385:964-1320(+)